MKTNYYILGKIFRKEEYGKSFLNGQIHINPLATFGTGKLLSGDNTLNKYRDDLNEGLRVNLHSSDLMPYEQVVTFFSDIGGIPTDVNTIGEIDSRFLSENISCFTALFYNISTGGFIKPSAELQQFQDAKNGDNGIAIVIHDVPEFLKRIYKTLAISLGSQYWAAYGLVDYSFSSSEDKYVDEFTKDNHYSYQNEFRLAIKLCGNEVLVNQEKETLRINQDGSIVLNIGCISDIAFLLSVEDYLNLEFPIEYQTIMNKQPCIIGSFYPPVPSEVSFAFPLLRTNEYTFITTEALYPIEHNSQPYSINLKRLTEMSNPSSQNQVLLTDIMEIYFSHLLDICRSTKDNEKVSSLLDTIAVFLIHLNANYFKGVQLNKNNSEIRDICVEHIIRNASSMNKNSYIAVKRDIGIKMTEYAELKLYGKEDGEILYEGRRYVRIVITKDGTLTSGMKIKKDDIFWVGYEKVKFRGC